MDMGHEKGSEKYAKHITQGEIESVHVLGKALQENRYKIRKILPDDEEWSLISLDETYSDVKLEDSISSEKTRKLFKESFSSISILPGFIATDLEGRIKTLERGGSDISAAALAHYLQVPLYFGKDVDGIYNKDPKNNSHVKYLKKINSSEIYRYGILNPNIKPYLTIPVWVGKYTDVDIKNKGTWIIPDL